MAADERAPSARRRVTHQRMRPRTSATRWRLDPRSWGQVTTFVLLGIAVLVAGWQFSESSGEWQNSAREEVRRSAALQENVRLVYTGEAPLAFRLAIAEARANGLLAIRDLDRVTLSEHTVATRAVAQLRAAASGAKLADSGYAEPGRGYDVLHRLADLIAENRAPDPSATFATADRHAAAGTTAAMGGMVAVLIAVLLAAMRWSAPRRTADVDLIPQPGAGTEPWRAEVTKLAAWALLALLPLTQLIVAAQEQRAQAHAAREAVRLSTTIFVSNQRNAFLTSSKLTVSTAEVEALARQFAALAAPTAAAVTSETTLANTEALIANELVRTAEYMGRPAAEGDGLAGDAREALNSEPSAWLGLLREQNRQVDAAEQASTRGLLVTTATGLAALAAALAAASATAARSRFRWTYVLLAAAVATAASGVFA